MILVLGDAMIDRYLWGDVTRISPEAPVPVAKIYKIEERHGGAANVLANVEAMGSKAIGVFGTDQPPVVKIRVIGKNQQMLRIDFDCWQTPIQPTEIPKEPNIIILADYGKGTLSQIEQLMPLFNGTILVDPKGFNYERYRGAHLIKPNLDEMKELVGGWLTEAQLVEKAQNLRAELGLKGILLTRASAGMTLFMEDEVENITATPQEVFDVSGAGDTAIAAFACALDRRYDWYAAAKCANKAAGIAVQHFGTYVVSEKEVFG